MSKWAREIILWPPVEGGEVIEAIQLVKEKLIADGCAENTIHVYLAAEEQTIHVVGFGRRNNENC